MNSMPTAISEKAVWLENNLAKFFLDRRLDRDLHMVDDVISIILARLNPHGAEELYEYLNDPPWNPERGNAREGTNGEK